MVPVNGMMLNKYKYFVILEKCQVKVKVEDESISTSFQTRRVRSVPVNGMMLKKCKSFVTLGKTQFKGKVNIEGEKHIYIIPVEHTYHYLLEVQLQWLYEICRVQNGNHQWHNVEQIFCDLGKRLI